MCFFITEFLTSPLQPRFKVLRPTLQVNVKVNLPLKVVLVYMEHELQILDRNVPAQLGAVQALGGGCSCSTLTISFELYGTSMSYGRPQAALAGLVICGLPGRTRAGVASCLPVQVQHGPIRP